METKTRQNGTAKKENATVKKEVQRKLTEEAIGKTVVSEKTKTVEKPTINLDDRIQKFEKLKGPPTSPHPQKPWLQQGRNGCCTEKVKKW